MRNSLVLPVSEARFRGSNERILSASGDINAGSTQELAKAFIEIANRIQQGELIQSEKVIDQRAVAVERAKVIREAYYDRSSSAWAEMGAALSEDFTLRLERDGFMRTILTRGNVEEGSIPRIRVKQKNVRAVVSRGVAQVYPQYLRDAYINADEFYIIAAPRVEEITLRQGGGDILEDKYYEGLEAILATEDRQVLKMLRMADSMYNPVTYFTGALTPATVQTVKYNVERWRIPVTNMILSIDLINDLTTGNTYSGWFDPISKWEIVQTGRIGTLLGLNIITDGYREKSLRVLNDGEFLVLGDPEFLGGYTDRGPVESRAVDEFDKVVPARGWSMWEIVSMAIANAKAVARGARTA